MLIIFFLLFLSVIIVRKNNLLLLLNLLDVFFGRHSTRRGLILSRGRRRYNSLQYGRSCDGEKGTLILPQGPAHLLGDGVWSRRVGHVDATC